MGADRLSDAARWTVSRPTPPRRYWRAVLAIVLLLLSAEAFAGWQLGSGVLHPANLNPPRPGQTQAMLDRTGAIKEDFSVRAPDGVRLRGWKIRAYSPNGDWILLFHGLSDNRSGNLGYAEILLRHG